MSLQHMHQWEPTQYSYLAADPIPIRLQKRDSPVVLSEKGKLAPQWIFNIQSHLSAVGVRFWRLWDNEHFLMSNFSAH